MTSLCASSLLVHLHRIQCAPLPSNQILHPKPNFNDQCLLRCGSVIRRRSGRTKGRPPIMATSSVDDTQNPPRLVTFLGKGGSGKTTTAVFAAQHYAAAGLRTCLVTHSQDVTVEYLLDRKIGNAPVLCGNNLSAVKLETANMLLEPLNRIKQADARVNMTQGVLEGIVGEELGVLPGMDSILSAFELMSLLGLVGDTSRRKEKDKFDVIIYDGISTIETLRMMGAASSARLYLKYVRNIADKTDFGRIAGPSVLRLADETLNLSQSSSNGNSSSQIWDSLERILERGSSIFAAPRNFGCYLVMDPCKVASVTSALRNWGFAIQAGSHISGAFGTGSPHADADALEATKKRFLPLPYASVPDLWKDLPLDWDAVLLNGSSKDARDLLVSSAKNDCCVPSVKFDIAQKSVTLFMPGFDKSEIKLYQYRGGSELLVEAGDQRRVIQLPPKVQGKVSGAKFIERNLVITMR